jgi:hypothetical protein
MRLFANVAGNSNAPWYRRFHLPRRIYWWLTMRNIPGHSWYEWWELPYWLHSLRTRHPNLPYHRKRQPPCNLTYPPAK